ncbi:MAG TPA: hypothetical protein VNP03_07595 [Pseudonocardia sp.]|nr:hypothetical protein [Pseudonocardia sp.]
MKSVESQDATSVEVTPLRFWHQSDDHPCCYTTGGYFCDGYILGSIGLVLPLIAGV